MSLAQFVILLIIGFVFVIHLRMTWRLLRRRSRGDTWQGKATILFVIAAVIILWVWVFSQVFLLL